VEPWLFIELGGSSAQTAQRDSRGHFRFSAGIVREPGRPVALACPGLIRDGRVLYATNLGWPDDADPAHELGFESVAILENDARAAGLGESILRSGETPELDLIYINLGTGVGDALVVNGVVSHLDSARHDLSGKNWSRYRTISSVEAPACPRR
jgi:hypothetical protein